MARTLEKRASYPQASKKRVIANKAANEAKKKKAAAQKKLRAAAAAPQKQKRVQPAANATPNTNLKKITKPALQRLGYKAGVVRMEGAVHTEARRLLMKFVRELSDKAWAFTDHAKRVTVSGQDVTQALAILGRPGYFSGIKAKKCEVPKGVKVETRMRQAQRQNECLTLSMGPFKDLFKAALLRENRAARVTAEAATIAQMASEAYLIDLFAKAQELAMHARRKTLQPRNLNLAK